MVLYGMKKEVLQGEEIWKCAHCLTCYERCPQDVKFAEVIEALRTMAIEEANKGNIRIKGPRVQFDSIFTNSISANGRVHEAGLISKYVMKTRNVKFLMSFAPLGLKMMRKGKVSLFPKKIKSLAEIRRVFEDSAKC